MVASHPVEIGVSHGRRKDRCQSKPDQARRRCENSRHSSKLLPSPTPLEAELTGCRLGMIEPQGRGKEYGNRGRDSPGRGGRRRADGGAAVRRQRAGSLRRPAAQTVRCRTGLLDQSVGALTRRKAAEAVAAVGAVGALTVCVFLFLCTPEIPWA